jgi:hypothetical protein
MASALILNKREGFIEKKPLPGGGRGESEITGRSLIA